jgi:hypothetical protein
MGFLVTVIGSHLFYEECKSKWHSEGFKILRIWLIPGFHIGLGLGE